MRYDKYGDMEKELSDFTRAMDYGLLGTSPVIEEYIKARSKRSKQAADY